MIFKKNNIIKIFVLKYLFIIIIIFCSLQIFANDSIIENSTLTPEDLNIDSDFTIKPVEELFPIYFNNFNEVVFSNSNPNENFKNTIFKLDLNFNFYKLNPIKKKYNYISNIGIGFPVHKKIYFGIGVQPYVLTNYIISNSKIINNIKTNILIINNNRINTIYNIIRFNLNENLYFGLRMNYIFGDFQKLQEYSLKERKINKGINKEYNFIKLEITPGLFLNKKINKKLNLNIGASCGGFIDFSNSLNFIIKNYSYSDNKRNNNFQINNEKQNNLYIKSLENDYSFTIGVYEKESWMLSTEYYNESIPILNLYNNNLFFNKKKNISFSGWIKPYNSIFIPNSIYKFNLYYQYIKLKEHNKNINKIGLKLIYVIPLNFIKKQNTILNISIELGKNKLGSYIFPKKKYMNIQIGLTLIDKWFIKDTID